MKKIKKVLVLTGSRAEYGLLRPVIKKIEKEKSMKLYLVLTECIFLQNLEKPHLK